MPTGKPTKMKKCSICGKLFVPTTPSTRICPDTHYANCPICNKKMVWNTTRNVEPCSRECRKKLTKMKNIEKYGVDHPMKNNDVQKRFRKSMKSKYGVEHALQKDEFKNKASHTIEKRYGVEWAQQNKHIKMKSKRTMMERYGGETTLQSNILKEKYITTMKSKYGHKNPMHIDSIKLRSKQTNIEQYGVPNPMQNIEIKGKSVSHRMDNIQAITDKIKQTCLERYGVDNPAKIPEVREKISNELKQKYPSFKDKMIETNLERYGVPYYCMTDECKDLQGNIISEINKRFGKLLSDFNMSYKFEHRINNSSYDIEIPDRNILIEIDPTYTHNVIGNHFGGGISKYYHRDKTKLAQDNGYRCIHVWDWDDWNTLMNIIAYPTRTIYARKCTVYRINKDIGDDFLNRYHIQKSCRGQLLYLGLVYEGELVELMTFGKSRYDKQFDIELLRLCTKYDTRVIGGASKLFSYATSEYGLSNIISYCDRSKFSGDVYEKIGMKLIRTTPPQEIWSRNTEHITANLLRARGYDQLFKTSYGKGSSNEELMLKSGWLPVYDCGQYVYAFK